MSTATLERPVHDKKLVVLPTKEIFADPEFNCRGKIIPLDVYDLAASIREEGLIEPIQVQRYEEGPSGTHYRVICGHRRHMAHLVNNMTEIQAIINEDVSDVDARILNLEENLKRRDLNLLQEAKVVNALQEKGLTSKDIQQRLGKGPMWVRARLLALRLPPLVQEEIEAGFIKQEHLEALWRLPPEEQLVKVREIKEIKQREGFRTRVKITKNTKRTRDRNRRVKRTSTDIGKMRDHILDTVGPNFGTRCLAWAEGNISSFDLYKDINLLAIDEGIDYEIPDVDICTVS